MVARMGHARNSSCASLTRASMLAGGVVLHRCSIPQWAAEMRALNGVGNPRIFLHSVSPITAVYFGSATHSKKGSAMEDDDYPDLPAGLVDKAPDHLALHERSFRRGDLPEDRLIALRDAIVLCAWYRVPPPKWIADAVTELCYKQILADRRPGRLGSYRARFRQHRIHLIRWATVRHLRDNCRERARTWNDAYVEASRELRRTIVQGSEEAMAASYKIYSRNPYLKLIKESGGAKALARTARQNFEARHAMLDVDRFFNE
jgi:hypothetical protein